MNHVDSGQAASKDAEYPCLTAKLEVSLSLTFKFFWNHADVIREGSHLLVVAAA